MFKRLKIKRVKQIQLECKLNIKRNLNQMMRDKFKIVYNLPKNSLYFSSYKIHITFQQAQK